MRETWLVCYPYILICTFYTFLLCLRFQKLDSIVFVIPEMQKKLDQTEAEKASIQEALDQQIQKEADRILQIEQGTLVMTSSTSY